MDALHPFHPLYLPRSWNGASSPSVVWSECPLLPTVQQDMPPVTHCAEILVPCYPLCSKICPLLPTVQQDMPPATHLQQNMPPATHCAARHAVFAAASCCRLPPPGLLLTKLYA